MVWWHQYLKIYTLHFLTRNAINARRNIRPPRYISISSCSLQLLSPYSSFYIPLHSFPFPYFFSAWFYAFPFLFFRLTIYVYCLNTHDLTTFCSIINILCVTNVQSIDNVIISIYSVIKAIGAFSFNKSWLCIFFWHNLRIILGRFQDFEPCISYVLY